MGLNEDGGVKTRGDCSRMPSPRPSKNWLSPTTTVEKASMLRARSEGPPSMKDESFWFNGESGGRRSPLQDASAGTGGSLQQSFPIIMSTINADTSKSTTTASAERVRQQQQQQQQELRGRRRSEPAVNVRRTSSPDTSPQRKRNNNNNNRQAPPSNQPTAQPFGVRNLYRRSASSSSFRSSASSGDNFGGKGSTERSQPGIERHDRRQQQQQPKRASYNLEQGLHQVGEQGSSTRQNEGSKTRHAGASHAESFVSLTTSSTASSSSNSNSTPKASLPPSFSSSSLQISPKEQAKQRPYCPTNTTTIHDGNNVDGFGPIITSPKARKILAGHHKSRKAALAASQDMAGSSGRRRSRLVEASQRISQSDIFVPLDDDDLFGDFCISPSLRKSTRDRSSTTETMNNSSSSKGNRENDEKGFDSDSDADYTMQVFLPTTPRLWASMPKMSPNSNIASPNDNDNQDESDNNISSSNNSKTATPTKTTSKKKENQKRQTKQKSRRQPKSMSMSHISYYAQEGQDPTPTISTATTTSSSSKGTGKVKKSKRRKSASNFPIIQEVKEHAKHILHASLTSLQPQQKSDMKDKKVQRDKKKKKKTNNSPKLTKGEKSRKKERPKSDPSFDAIEFNVEDETESYEDAERDTLQLLSSPESTASSTQHFDIEWNPPAFAIAEAEIIAYSGKSGGGGSSRRARRASVPASAKDIPYEPVTPVFSNDGKKRRDSFSSLAAPGTSTTPPFAKNQINNNGNNIEHWNQAAAAVGVVSYENGNENDKNEEVKASAKEWLNSNSEPMGPRQTNKTSVEKATREGKPRSKSVPPSKSKKAKAVTKESETSLQISKGSSMRDSIAHNKKVMSEPRIAGQRSHRTSRKAKRRWSTFVLEMSSAPTSRMNNVADKLDRPERHRMGEKRQSRSRSKSSNPNRLGKDKSNISGESFSPTTPTSRKKKKTTSRSSKRQGSDPGLSSSLPCQHRIEKDKGASSQRRDASKSPGPERRRSSRRRSKSPLTRSSSGLRESSESSALPENSKTDSKTTKRSIRSNSSKRRSERRTSLPPTLSNSNDLSARMANGEKPDVADSHCVTAPHELSQSHSNISSQREKKKKKKSTSSMEKVSSRLVGENGDSRQRKGTKTSRKRSKSPASTKRRASVAMQSTERRLGSHIKSGPSTMSMAESSWSGLTHSTSVTEKHSHLR